MCEEEKEEAAQKRRNGYLQPEYGRVGIPAISAPAATASEQECEARPGVGGTARPVCDSGC
jgi:hypothetical protein